jgi:lysophospholipase L1-like esterase
VVVADDTGLTAGTQYCYEVRALGEPPIPSSPFSNKACATPVAVALVVRIVLFGDSNTDRCEDVQPPNRISSYVSVMPRLGPADPHHACSVPGKVQLAWEGLRNETIRVVNHGIASTTTGGGGFGGPNRTSKGSPNARLKVGGYTRFEGEVLGKGYPWSGGEPTNSSFPNGPVRRVNAYVPEENDFVYVSMGTNDDAGPTRTMTAAQTEANLRWMIQQWTAAGRAPDHFILTTLAPRDDANSPTSIPDRNALIRALAAETGAHLVDLAAYTSDDDGATWRSPSLNIGDGIHYTEAVRAWLGEQVAAWMSAEVPSGL